MSQLKRSRAHHERLFTFENPKGTQTQNHLKPFATRVEKVTPQTSVGGANAENAPAWFINPKPQHGSSNNRAKYRAEKDSGTTQSSSKDLN